MAIDFVERAALNVDNLFDSEIIALQNNPSFRKQVIERVKQKHLKTEEDWLFLRQFETFSKQESEHSNIHTGSKPELIKSLYVASKPELVKGIELIKVANYDLHRLILDRKLSMYDLSERQFEHLMVEILKEKLRCTDVFLSQCTHDKGFDVMGYFEAPTGSKTKIIVECKRYASDRFVEIGLLRTLNQVQITQNAQVALMATTGRFRKTLDKFVREEIKIGVMDFADSTKIMEWIKR